MIFLDKKTVLRDLKEHSTDTLDYDLLISQHNDTLDIKSIELENKWHLNKAVTMCINKQKAIIIDKETRTRVAEIKRRKFNYQNGPRSGRGGVEYIDKTKDFVIIRLTFWIS